MEKTGKEANRFGLIGRNIAYSFSRGYFGRKFRALGLEHHTYENFDLEDIHVLPDLLRENPDLKGLNVTIPYKEAVIPLLDGLKGEAAHIGAVNTLCFEKEGLIGYNTDVYGFQKTLEPLLSGRQEEALVLGTGGASKAVVYVLEKLNIPFLQVSRTPATHQRSYESLSEEDIRSRTIIINATPLGTHPNIHQKPPIPYSGIGSRHLLYDLIYNPERTAFLKEGESRGARVMNGLQMLENQAERAWELWNR